MRLTLRTLLAYLDNTLDPQDAETLRNKLSESGFATQLVQRIHALLASRNVSAPPFDAKGPLAEANVIGEYLDSTLPVEQVAEIERACLESDAHLAEAAACHQILTIVLKNKAEIPQELRQRIYDLPDRQLEDIAAVGSFSGVSIPPESPELQPLAGPLPTSDQTAQPASKPVRPVGPDDSGVSDAPTRLRQTEAGRPAESGQAAIAGSRPRSVDSETKIYGGSIRPSRLAPWLVSLGLAAVLLFVLAQLFKPLFDKQRLVQADGSQDTIESIAELQSGAPDVGATQTEAGDDQSDAVQDRDQAQPSSPSKQGPTDESVPPQPSVTTSETDEQTELDRAAQPTDTAADATPASTPETEDGVPQNDQPAGTEPSPTSEQPSAPDRIARAADSSPSATETAEGSETAEATSNVGDGGATAMNQPAIDEASPPPPLPPQPEPPTAEEVAADADKPKPMATDEVTGVEVAKLLSADTLITALVNDQWVHVAQDAAIVADTPIVCAPTFRAELAIPEGKITLIGPCQVEWVTQDNREVSTLFVDHGKLLVSSTQSGTTLPLRLGAERVQIELADPESIAAIEVTYYRDPGFDPLIPENRIPITRVIAAEGSVTVGGARGQSMSLETGQQRARRGADEPEVTTVEAMPQWMEPAETPFMASTRSGLLELLDGSQPLELQLREATLFRRSEVAALAARFLLAMGQSDVYFGGDGVFNEPKQRTYWPEHYTAVMAEIDRSAASAEQLQDSIVRMDSANANALLRLLTGFSQQQLEGGADAELVQWLDSPSMAVRVLALQNLNNITGTTLYFRADQENAVRRAADIKKWETRLRKGDIRWQE